MKEKNRCMELFLTFLRIGAFTFGGGYAMIPLIKREIVETKQWLCDEEMLDIIAIAESTPGPLAINAATFVGKHTAGTKGALAATTGVALPSFLIILGISFVLKSVEKLRLVTYAFMGIRAGVLVLILSAFISMIRQIKKDVWNCMLMVAAFLCVGLFHVSAIVVLLVCAIAGIVRTICMTRREA